MWLHAGQSTAATAAVGCTIGSTKPAPEVLMCEGAARHLPVHVAACTWHHLVATSSSVPLSRAHAALLAMATFPNDGTTQVHNGLSMPQCLWRANQNEPSITEPNHADQIRCDLRSIGCRHVDSNISAMIAVAWVLTYRNRAAAADAYLFHQAPQDFCFRILELLVFRAATSQALPWCIWLSHVGVKHLPDRRSSTSTTKQSACTL